MKKVLAIVLSLVMAFAFCVPSFAETTAAPGGGFDFSTIVETITNILGNFIPSDASLPDLGGIVDSIGSIIGNLIPSSEQGGAAITISPAMAKRIVDSMLQTGATKDDIRTAVEQMYTDGQIDEVSYQNLMTAIDEAVEPDTTVAVSDEDAAKAAAEIIKTLKKMGIPQDTIQSVVDAMYENGTIPQNVYDEIVKQLNASESTTDAENEGGIGGFLGGIFDTVKDFFGGIFGGGDAGGEGGSSTNPNEYGGNEPTGDTAILSVAAVAAVAGIALVLTKKKQK